MHRIHRVIKHCMVICDASPFQIEPAGFSAPDGNHFLQDAMVI